MAVADPGTGSAGIVLAAGASTRMGAPKPALEYGSSTLVGAVVSAAGDAGLDPVIVVTGFDEDAVTRAVGEMAETIENPHPEAGNLSSLLVGLEAVRYVGCVVVLLADMPQVDASVIRALAAGMASSGSLGGWVEYADEMGHPVALGRDAFEDVRTLTGPRSLWGYLSSLSESDRFVLNVDRPKPADVNTPEDYGGLPGVVS